MRTDRVRGPGFISARCMRGAHAALVCVISADLEREAQRLGHRDGLLVAVTHHGRVVGDFDVEDTRAAAQTRELDGDIRGQPADRVVRGVGGSCHHDFLPVPAHSAMVHVPDAPVDEEPGAGGPQLGGL